MRIAVIEHAESGDYTEAVFSLIQQKANELAYQVKAWSNSVPVSQQRIGDDAVVFISLETKSNFLLNWMYNVKLPSIIKKIKADVVVDLNGIASNKIKAPQCIAAGPELFNADAKQLSKIEKFAQQHFKASQQLATATLIYSNQKKENPAITQQEKLHSLPFTAPEIFKTFEWHEKIMAKAQFADNKEYFIAVVEDEAVNDLVLLLKGFSKFKKWQQSNMKLLVLPKYESFNAGVREKLSTYKYKNDVELLEDLEEKEITSLFGSASALIHIPATYPQLLVLAIAMQCSLPVVSFNNEDVKEYCGEAALFCSEKSDEALGYALIELYKNENFQKQLKEAAGKQSLHLNRAEFTNKLWQLLETAAKK